MKYYLFDTAPWEIFYDISACTGAEAIRSFVHAYPRSIFPHGEIRPEAAQACRTHVGNRRRQQSVCAAHKKTESLNSGRLETGF